MRGPCATRCHVMKLARGRQVTSPPVQVGAMRSYFFQETAQGGCLDVRLSLNLAPNFYLANCVAVSSNLPGGHQDLPNMES